MADSCLSSFTVSDEGTRLTAVGIRVLVSGIDESVGTISGFTPEERRGRVPKTTISGQGVRLRAVRAEVTIWRAEGTRTMGGSISSGAVAAHAGLPTVEDSVVVVQVT